MSALRAIELKVPPALLAALLALVMGALAFDVDTWRWRSTFSLLSTAGVFVLGAVPIAFGVQNLRHAQTSLSPLNPGTASVLVTQGMYSTSRNPIYLGLLILLLALAKLLATPWGFIGPIVFFLYVQRFQIKPEEEALARKFGVAYEEYKNEVRRWV